MYVDNFIHFDVFPCLSAVLPKSSVPVGQTRMFHRQRPSPVPQWEGQGNQPVALLHGQEEEVGGRSLTAVGEWAELVVVVPVKALQVEEEEE